MCVNTCIALSVALYTNNDINLACIGTHDVEAFFGMIRNLSYGNDTFANSINTAVRSILLNIQYNSLDFKINILSRDNEGGSNLNSEIFCSECFNTDFSYIVDSLLLLLRSMKYILLSNASIRIQIILI